MKLNALEKAILDYVAQQNPDCSLKIQIAKAEVIRRKHTGAGIYAYIFHPQKEESLKIKSAPKQYLGPKNINSTQLQFGAGSIVWCDDGFLSQIEIFSYSNDYPKNEFEFSISDK